MAVEYFKRQELDQFLHFWLLHLLILVNIWRFFFLSLRQPLSLLVKQDEGEFRLWRKGQKFPVKGVWLAVLEARFPVRVWLGAETRRFSCRTLFLSWGCRWGCPLRCHTTGRVLTPARRWLVIWGWALWEGRPVITTTQQAWVMETNQMALENLCRPRFRQSSSVNRFLKTVETTDMKTTLTDFF